LARKILLADDSVTAQNMGRKILADAGYDVVTVNNGSAALKRITELKPDLIVLDVYMPGYSGLEVCQRLKDAAETARIPVLLTVGKLEPFKAEEARRVRADAHIVKPFEASELLTAITRLEDRMVPQKSPEADVSAETGWTSRLSFPSKKKKDVTEPEDVAAEAGFRDFRKGKGKGKTGAGGALPMKAASPEQDPVPVPDIPRDITPEELDALSELAAKLDGPAAADENTAPPAKFESPAPVVEPAVQSVAAAIAVEPAALAVEEKNEVEIPAEKAETVESMEPVLEAAALVVVNAAHLAQEPAPVDKDDEPMFASTASAVEQAAEEGMAGKPSEAEEPAPSDSELAEALRLLTPATGHADVATIPSHGTLVAAGQLLAEEAARHAAAPPRWVAEPVALSSEEAAISLEAEMFRTFAAMPMTMPVPASSPRGDLEAAPITGVSAIAAAVENRLAEAGLAASSKALPDGAESCSETTANEASAKGTPAEAVAAVSEAASPVVDAAEAEKTEHKDPPVPVAEQIPAEEILAATQEAPKAMAAAAAADGGSASVPATDASTIANIVDSMLADLRPKLMEEIAKKMAGK
jgi:CheY-like chemotaxis protein